MTTRGICHLLAVGLFAFAACDCSDDGGTVSLTILAPAHGATLTRGDDEDPSTEATIEVTVEVEAANLDAGEPVFLFADAETADTDEPLAMAEVADGLAVFEQVSFVVGSYRLQARARMGGLQSEVVAVDVTTSCATTRFIAPAPPPGTELTLGPAADEDGEACGAAFETTITVSTDAGDGREARLFVNGMMRATTTVEGTVATFRGVQLDRRGATPNLLEVEVDSDIGTCREPFPADVFVDCEGVSCSIASPTGAFLNQDDDVSDAEGFQTDVVVSSDSEAVGQPVLLVVDGDESGAREVTATMAGGGAEALFGNLPLSEGTHRVRALCTDGVGNVMPSAEVMYTVDITPCGVAISEPVADQLFVDADDVDDATAGIQIDVSGAASGTDCQSFRVGLCSSISGAGFDALSETAFATQTTLGSGETQELCAQVQDEAGNVGEARVTIQVDSDAPQVEIATPTDGDGFNAAGTGGRTADLDPSTDSCEVAFDVYCTDVGLPVTLHRMGVSAVLPGGSADCVADASVPAPYAGRATFASVSVPTIDAGTAISIVAQQDTGRLVGLSAGVGLLSDCNAPDLSVSRPVCGTILRPSTQDEDTATAGFQYLVRIINNNTPKPPVDLEIRDAGGSLVYDAMSSMPAAPSLVTDFPSADFGSGGVLDVIACSTDNAGNVGCAPMCQVTVADLPTLTITEPSMGDVLTEADDCDGATAGLQVQVSATTDAPDGSSATVEVTPGTTIATTASGGSISVCTDAADGRDVPITVTVTDASRGTSTAMVTVDIDSAAPTDAIADLTATAVDRRGGTIRFQWTAVDDAGGIRLEAYQLRCADTAITTEADWSAATSVGMTTIPGSAGTVQSEDVAGFRVGATRFCMLRGVDVAGRLTPLGNSPEATLNFQQVEVTEAGSIQLGYSVTAIGDVNSDGFDDVLMGAPTLFSGLSGSAQAFLYFGSATGLSTSPDVQFIGRHASFGAEVHGLGDFNGDGLPDFAIAERGRDGAQGAVYVLFGRASADPWPATIDLSTGCAADVCFVAAGGAGVVTFGWSLASADFNGDGLMDLVVGAPFINRVYVLLGASGFASGSSFTVPASAVIVSDPVQPAGFYYDGGSSVSLLGVSTLSLGHFVGSGEHDVFMGAPGDSTSGIAGAVKYLAGRAYGGSAVGLQGIATTEAVTLDTGSAGSFGEVLGSADYDGAGGPDLIVESSTTAGRVFLYPNSSGFSATTRVEFANDIASSGGDRYGVSLGHAQHPWLGSLGRIDAADTRQELLLGSNEYGTEVGDLTLFFGQSSIAGRARSTADVRLQPPAAGGTSGIRVGAYLGDVNGDGFNDIALGDRAANSSVGRVIIFY